MDERIIWIVVYEYGLVNDLSVFEESVYIVDGMNWRVCILCGGR